MLNTALCYGKDDAVLKKWKNVNKEKGYKPTNGYKGPNAETYDYPTNIRNENNINSGGSFNINPYQGVPYKESELKQGQKGGNIEEDPEIEKAEPIELPEVDTPDAPEIEYPSGVGTFFYYLGIIVLLIACAYIVYQIVKNYNGKSNKSLPFEPIIEDINPIEIPKSELQLKLEQALIAGEYKECVRIYLLFSLKELIEKRWIFWKKEKTNMHYIIELQGKDILVSFEKIVSFYDLFWYGEYQLDKKIYSEIEPQLKSAYQAIEQVK